MSKNNPSIYTDSDSDDYLDDEAFFTVNGAANDVTTRKTQSMPIS